MIRSLLRHDPAARIYVLCLDDVTEQVLADMSAQIISVPMADLLAADPEFAAAKDNRSQIEWYFTATSCWVNYLLQRYPELHTLVYLDSDLYFYATPQYLIDEANGASVQIIEHRFIPQWAGLVVYGRFNVGWIAFSNSKEGRQVVADYRASCLEWCYDRLEADRFGDQKYLDKWPERYPNCCVSKIKGANVAWWNMGHWQPQQFADRLFVGESLLIFFHFQGVKRIEDGCYTTQRAAAEFGSYYDLVMAPYLDELSAVDAELRPFIEHLKISDIRYHSW